MIIGTLKHLSIAVLVTSLTVNPLLISAASAKQHGQQAQQNNQQQAKQNKNQNKKQHKKAGKKNKKDKQFKNQKAKSQKKIKKQNQKAHKKNKKQNQKAYQKSKKQNQKAYKKNKKQNQKIAKNSNGKQWKGNNGWKSGDGWKGNKGWKNNDGWKGNKGWKSGDGWKGKNGKHAKHANNKNWHKHPYKWKKRNSFKVRHYKHRHHHVHVPKYRKRYYRNHVVHRPYGHWYHGYGYHDHDDDAWKWLAFTAITFVLLDALTETQQRAHEHAQVLATDAPVGESIYWNDGNASGAVTTTRDGWSSAGRYCREFQQTIIIGGRSEDAYGTACQRPDGSWEIISNG